MRVAIVWFRNDLRLADHPALAGACRAAERVVPVYVHAPDEAAPWQPGGASRWWLHHSLAALDAALRARGSALAVVRGPSALALRAVAVAVGAGTVFFNRESEPTLVERDAEVARTLAAAGVEIATFAGNALFDPAALHTQAGEPYRVFTPFWRACEPRLGSVAAPVAAPERLAPPPAVPGAEPLELIGLLPKHAWHAGIAARFAPGEAPAMLRLKAFLAASVRPYPEARDRPDRPGTSRLSPHLHFGELSPRQVLAEVRSAEHAAGGAGVARGAEAFLRQLGWREFARHVLSHFPHTSEAALDARFAGHEWRADPAALAAWQRGATGFPLVDAGMRELWHSGWMHNRVRMVVASMLTKNLGIHWRDGARWFHDTLVDADLANNSLGWQWVAGCGADAAPYYRIFNPTLQALRFDPAREYLRRWLPELARLPDQWLVQPAAAPRTVLAAAGVEIGRTYPAPIVDLKLSRARALERWARARGARIQGARGHERLPTGR